MNRRDFSLQLTAAAGVAALGVPGLALAQAAQEGKDFNKVSPPAAVAAPAGKVEVVEFFWYGCPHCNALEPQLEAWVKKLPADVAFRRVPVGFSPVHEFHQKIYYALEAMNQVEALHAKVFAAIHVDHKPLGKDADVAAFFNSIGQNGDKVVELTKSFSVSGKARAAKQLAGAYHIDGVPMVGVQGRFLTSASMTGSPERLFAVADQLIQQVRKGG